MDRLPSDGTQIRVLIADDDGAFLESLQGLIDRQPELAVVGTALDGLEAIELAEHLDPDAVVIDLHMPLLDGVSAAARLRKDHPNLCLIALTGDEAPTMCCSRTSSCTASSNGSPPCGRAADGEGRNRTGDTTVFSRVLYQLSYLAAGRLV